MVGLRGMGNIARIQSRHVTINTRIMKFTTRGQRSGARRRGISIVAIQTTRAVERESLFGGWGLMRVMARRASELAVTLEIAFAGVHLLHLTDRSSGRTRRIDAVSPHESRPDIAQAISRTKIELAPSVTQNALNSLKMTLIADIIAQYRRQIRRVDDRVFLGCRREGLLSAWNGMKVDVFSARTVTPFTSDRFLTKRVRRVSMRAAVVGCHQAGVAGQASIRRTSAESWVRRGSVTGREVEPMPFRVPGDGRHKQQSFPIQQIGPTSLSRTDGELDWSGLLVDNLSINITQSFAVQNDAFTDLHPVETARKRLEGRVPCVIFDRLLQDIGQGMCHRMRLVRGGDLGMAFRARFRADVSLRPRGGTGGGSVGGLFVPVIVAANLLSLRFLATAARQ